MASHSPAQTPTALQPQASSSEPQPRMRQPRPPLPPPHILQSLVPDSPAFTELMEVEQKLDWTLLRKKAEINDALGRSQRVRRSLRVFISNTAHHQTWQAGEDVEMGAAEAQAAGSDSAKGESIGGEGSAEAKADLASGKGVPGWVLRIEGRLVDSGNNRLDKTKRKFSTFLRSVVVELDGREVPTYPEGNIIEARGPRCSPPFGGSSRSQVLPPQAEGFPFFQIPELVTRHLAHPDPVVIPYEIRVDQDFNFHHQCYDIPVDLEDPLKSKMAQIVASYEGADGVEVVKLEEKVGELAYLSHDLKQKRDFLDSFAANPQAFIENWLAAQARDLDQMLGYQIGLPGVNGGNVREEDLRRSDLFSLPWVDEALGVMEAQRVGSEQRASRGQ
ncbi:SWI/SNF and RSC complex subunit Ssr3 [Cryptotrichosporon argae]